MTFILLVTGSREKTWPDPVAARAELRHRLDAIRDRHGPLLVRHGGASGVDQWAGEWAAETDGGQEVYRPDWSACAEDCPPWPNHRRVNPTGDGFCPAAGHRRNTMMVNAEPRADGCLAMICARSAGASGCAWLARLAGIPTWAIEHSRQGALW